MRVGRWRDPEWTGTCWSTPETSKFGPTCPPMLRWTPETFQFTVNTKTANLCLKWIYVLLQKAPISQSWRPLKSTLNRKKIRKRKRYGREEIISSTTAENWQCGNFWCFTLVRKFEATSWSFVIRWSLNDCAEFWRRKQKDWWTTRRKTGSRSLCFIYYFYFAPWLCNNPVCCTWADGLILFLF